MADKPYLAHWSDDSDGNTETVATIDEARAVINKWLDERRGDADGGWSFDMRGYVAHIAEQVVEVKTEAPEGSEFKHFAEYRLMPVADPLSARLASLEAENAGLKARVVEPRALPTVEDVSARVHEAWMESKRRAGVTSRKLEGGEELMVPYADLSEQAKELDRATVRAVYAAIGAAGRPEPAPLRLGRGPTVEEAKAHADAQEDGHGWWLVSFDVKRRPDDEAIYFEIASIEVEDGEVFVDGMSSADGSRYTEITDAIPLDASRQPCGVGVKL